MIFNEECITDEGFFNNGIYGEWDSCRIYMDEEVVGKECWDIQLIFFRGLDYPVDYCIRFYKGTYNGEGILDSNIEIARISIHEPTYVILPDRHYILSDEEVMKFDFIMSRYWDKLMSTLNKELSFEPNYKPIYLNKPDYKFLQYYNLIK